MYYQNPINRKSDPHENFWFENGEEKSTFPSPSQKITPNEQGQNKHKQTL